MNPLRRLPSRSLPLLIAVLALGIFAPSALADPGGTVSLDGNGLLTFAGPDTASTLNYTLGDDGQYVQVLFENFGTTVTIDPSAADVTSSDCTEFVDSGHVAHPYGVQCFVLAAGIKVQGGNANDQIQDSGSDVEPVPITLDGGAGADTLSGGDNVETLDGGDGDDRLLGGNGNDVLDGGTGDDVLLGQAGDDQLHGGDGNDSLYGDGSDGAVPSSVMGNDLLDGGAGNDTVDYSAYAQPINVTLDGVANDGRVGEADNLVSIERVITGNGGTIVGSDGPETLDGFGTVGTTLRGLGGNDIIEGGDGPDTIDGGAGDDTLTGGSGDDTITGGPGRDTINGDRPFDCVSGPIYTSCSFASGNDTINAVDGEQDSITCGPGVDTVMADPIDVVAADCENVTRVGAVVAPPPPPPPPAAAPIPKPIPPVSCKVPSLKGLSLAAAKSKLKKVHCALGSTTPRRLKHSYVVLKQGTKAGKITKAGTKISLTLGSKPKPKPKKKKKAKHHHTARVAV